MTAREAARSRRVGSAGAVFSERRLLLVEARRRLLSRGWPRLQTTLIVAAAGACGFVASASLLRLGVDSMAWRYAAAAGASYVAFLGLVGVWVRWHRGADIPVDTALDVFPAESWPDVTVSGAEPLFEGGASGGAGGGATFDLASAGARPPAPSARLIDAAATSDDGSWFDWLEGDDAAFVLLAAACAVAGLTAVAYVIYAAPVLLAEVALDAALLGALYRRLRSEDTRHWSRGLVRGTWLAAAVVVLSAGGVGYFAQRAVPEARSIGGVVRGLTSRADAPPVPLIQPSVQPSR